VVSQGQHLREEKKIMSEEYAPIILPTEPHKVIAVRNGTNWIHNIDSRTVQISRDTVTFVARWNDGSRRRITLALESVTGWQERE
jgi:hypothetical protein